MSVTQSTGQVEQWRGIPGYPGYQVSDLGRIQSKRHRNGMPSETWRTMDPAPNGRGYLQVCLRAADGKTRWVELHRLVWEVFHGPVADGLVVRHADDPDPLNCRLDNLACGTQADNCQDKKRHGTAQELENHPRAILTEEQVRQARRRVRRVIANLAVNWGVKTVTLESAVMGRTWKALKE